MYTFANIQNVIQFVNKTFPKTQNTPTPNFPPKKWLKKSSFSYLGIKRFQDVKFLNFLIFFYSISKTLCFLAAHCVQFWAVLLTNWAKGGMSIDVTPTRARPCWALEATGAGRARSQADTVRSGGLYAVGRLLCQINILTHLTGFEPWKPKATKNHW